MRIGIIGDTHFGFSFGTEKGEDSYREAERAISALLEKSPDVVLLAGDVFDSAVPRQEILARAADAIFSRFSKTERNPSPRVEISGKALDLRGIPVLAIHGTHERRPKGLTNPLQVLAKAGVLGYIHAERAEITLGPEKVAVFGIGGIPEDYFPDALKKISPAPDSGAGTNIFLFHQNVSPFIYGAPGITLGALPKGFDYYVDGHLHKGFLERTPEGKQVLFTGSTITTQMRKDECGRRKSVWIIDTKEKELEEIAFSPFRESALVDAKSLPEAVLGLEKFLSSIPEGSERPNVKVRFSGEIAESEIGELAQNFSEKAILSIELDRQDSGTSGKGAGLLGHSPSENSISPEEKVSRIVSELLSGKFPKAVPERIELVYSLLSSGETEKALEEAISLGEA